VITFIRQSGFDVEERPPAPSPSPALLDVVTKLLREQPFCFFRIAYGGELQIHLGEIREFPSARLRRRERGSYVLGTRASAWVVYSKGESTLLASDRDAVAGLVDQAGPGVGADARLIEEGDYVPAGTAVKDVALHRVHDGVGLRLRFLDGSRVDVLPTDADREDASDGADDELPDWELLDADSHLLSVGPGVKWSYDETD